MKKQQEIQKNLADFKGVSNIPGITSAKKKVIITKIKNERGEIITSREGIANVFGELYKNFTTTMSKTKLNKKSVRNENSIDVHNNNTNEMMRIPETTSEELQDQETQKKVNHQIATGSEPKTSKHATMRREKW